MAIALRKSACKAGCAGLPGERKCVPSIKNALAKSGKDHAMKKFLAAVAFIGFIASPAFAAPVYQPSYNCPITQYDSSGAQIATFCR